MAIQLSTQGSGKKNKFNYQPTSLAEINITPLVDVMLVLLIIFMITAPLMSEGIDINLPNAKAQSIQTQTDDVVLSIEKNGQLFLQGDKKALSVEQIQIKLKEIYKDKAKKEIFLRADSSVSYGRVIEIMSLCKSLGIERIGMVTEPS